MIIFFSLTDLQNSGHHLSNSILLAYIIYYKEVRYKSLFLNKYKEQEQTRSLLDILKHKIPSPCVVLNIDIKNSPPSLNNKINIDNNINIDNINNG